MNPLLRFEITWTDPPGGDREAGPALAWGAGIAYVADVPVWFSGKLDTPQPVLWSWIELLEFLASRWLHLTTEQTYPYEIVLDDPRELRAAARRRFSDDSGDGDLPDDVDEELFRFEGRHDLARAARGLSLPSVFILREGETVSVAATSGVHTANRNAFFHELENIGDRIAERIRPSGTERAKAAIDAWNRRRTPNPAQLIRIASGEAKTGTPTLAFWELANEAGADSELAAAARFMRGAKPSSRDFDVILSTIRKRPRAECAALDAVAATLKNELIASRDKDPYEQGYSLALALRKQLSVADEKLVAVEKIVAEFGIGILEEVLSRDIDAVGCWGNQHGPAVIVNTAGRRSSTVPGRRFTIAHELCHLIADRATALPLAEVMGGSSPYIPERRANAFAAEFLLPRWQARLAYKEHGSLDKALSSLTVRFRVGLVLAAAQLLNARNTGVSTAEQTRLEHLVKEDPAY